MSSSSSISERRHRASLSTTTILTPPPETHIPSQDTNYLSVSQDDRRNSSSSQLSSSAPSFTSYLSNNNSPRRQRSSSNASSRRDSITTNLSSLNIEFDGGNHIIIRPNHIIRGKVVLDLVEKTQIMRIKIKFRADELAMVKVDEGDGSWIHEMITTFFETEWKLHGQEFSPYSQSAWEELDPGHYDFPFALKFPNVNYPPSMEEPAGFGIRFIWTAQVDGPALLSGIKSTEYITPYRPIIVATEDKEWVYKTTLMKEKKQALAEVQAKLYKQTYCPDEAFKMQLNMTTLHSDSKISNLSFRLRKHHEGKMLVQQGTAFQESIRHILQETVNITNSSTISETIEFNIPTRLVSPSYCSRHTRVYYDLCFQVTIDQGHLFKTSQTSEFAIPLTIANLPYDQLLRIPNLTFIQHYRQSKECPVFFDPTLDEPPQGLPSELLGPLTAALMSPEDQPPSYFSLPELPPQLELLKERKEKTVFMTRQARGANLNPDLSDATIIQGLYDEDW